jgi:hypothetical protein
LSLTPGSMLISSQLNPFVFFLLPSLTASLTHLLNSY